MLNLIHGDCLIEMQSIPDKSIDAIICDLPYGTTACRWDTVIPFELLWSQYERVIKDDGAIVLFGAEPFSSLLRLSNLKLYKYDWVWRKTHPKGHLNAKKQPMRAHEVMSVFYKKQCLYNPQKTTGHARKVAKTSYIKESNGDSVYGKEVRDTAYDSTERYPTSVQTFSNADLTNVLHPTQKPLELLEYLVKTYTNEGDTVLDNTMGSGTTGVACINLKRGFVGIEMDDNYFEIAKKRIAESYL